MLGYFKDRDNRILFGCFIVGLLCAFVATYSLHKIFFEPRARQVCEAQGKIFDGLAYRVDYRPKYPLTDALRPVQGVWCATPPSATSTGSAEFVRIQFFSSHPTTDWLIKSGYDLLVTEIFIFGLPILAYLRFNKPEKK